MTSDKQLQEFAQIFRCTPEMAPTYIARIHERMKYEVPMDSILAAMKKIAPKKLSMDTIVERLRKMERGSARSRQAKAEADPDDPIDTEEPDETPTASAPRRAKPAGAPAKPGALTQIDRILLNNWARGRKQGLRPPVMTAEQFVRTTQSLAGVPKPSLTRVLEAVQKLDRRDVLLTPNLAADEINESGE